MFFAITAAWEMNIIPAKAPAQHLKSGCHGHALHQSVCKQWNENRAAAVAGGRETSDKAAFIREELHCVGYHCAVDHAVSEAAAQAVAGDQPGDRLAEACADHTEAEEQCSCKQNHAGSQSVVDRTAGDHGNRPHCVRHSKHDGQTRNLPAGEGRQMLSHGPGEHAPGIKRADAERHEAAGDQDKVPVCFLFHLIILRSRSRQKSAHQYRF